MVDIRDIGEAAAIELMRRERNARPRDLYSGGAGRPVARGNRRDVGRGAWPRNALQG
jgi:hypothetical protein